MHGLLIVRKCNKELSAGPCLGCFEPGDNNAGASTEDTASRTSDAAVVDQYHSLRVRRDVVPRRVGQVLHYFKSDKQANQILRSSSIYGASPPSLIYTATNARCAGTTTAATVA